MRNAYEITVGKPEGKRQRGRPRRKWKGSVRAHLTEIRWEGLDCIRLTRDINWW